MKYIVATLRVPVESQPELIAVLTRCREATLREPAGRGFEVLVSATDSEKVVVVESFDSPGIIRRMARCHMYAPCTRSPSGEKTFENIYADRVEIDHG